ncbi:MAG: response regulator [Granulosicoccus sp.]
MSTNKQTILVVDDEPAVRKLLRRAFELESYNVLESENRQQTIDAISEHKIDLVTLDINLDGDDGLSVAQEIRGLSPVPIIMVTGKGELIDTIVGLEMGADDYISKPFQIREVLARVKSALRRSELDRKAANEVAHHQNASHSTQYCFAQCTLDVQTRDLTGSDGKVCELTTAEFDLLEVLVSHSLRALTRNQIMDQLKGNDWNPNDRTIDNRIAKLRKKLTTLGVSRAIKTVRGVGYQFTYKVEII